jgi:hypothetical protein
MSIGENCNVNIQRYKSQVDEFPEAQTITVFCNVYYQSVCMYKKNLINPVPRSKRIEEKNTLCRICSSHFMGWLVYIL